jgi:hypothetical protein
MGRQKLDDMDQNAPSGSTIPLPPRALPIRQAPALEIPMTRTVLLAIRILLSTATFANAGSLGRPCTTTPQNQWLSLDALQAKVEALGYTVQKAKLKAACGEFYSIDRNGGRVELFVDPASAAIVGKL